MVNSAATDCYRFIKQFTLGKVSKSEAQTMIDVEIQNETSQSHERLKFSVVPRIGEGVRLQDKNGFWSSYDILDLWYQKAEYGDVWVPYLHVRKTAGEQEVVGAPKSSAEHGEVVPFTI
jgi:hypothetical protein